MKRFLVSLAFVASLLIGGQCQAQVPPLTPEQITQLLNDAQALGAANANYVTAQGVVVSTSAALVTAQSTAATTNSALATAEAAIESDIASWPTNAQKAVRDSIKASCRCGTTSGDLTLDEKKDVRRAALAGVEGRAYVGRNRDVWQAFKEASADADAGRTDVQARMAARIDGLGRTPRPANPNRICTIIMVTNTIMPMVMSMMQPPQVWVPIPMPPCCTTMTCGTPTAATIPLPAPQETSIPPLPKKYSTGLKLAPVEVRQAKHAASARMHTKAEAGIAKRATDPLPATYDCRVYCTPIKDQGNCGSCWDFSGVGVNEGANIKAGYLTATISGQLSEQFVLDGCAGSNGGCGGDDNVTVLADAKNMGIPLTSAYGPYQAYDAGCHAISGTGTTLYTLSDWGYADSSTTGVADTSKIKAAMMQYGPIGCAVAADDAFQNYSGGVFTSNSQDINHDIMLVGWDDSKGAWLLRNSWNTSWGISGYMWIAYGSAQVGTEAVWGVAGKPVPYVAPPTPPGPTPTRRASVIMEKATRVYQSNPALALKALEAAEDVLQNAP